MICVGRTRTYSRGAAVSPTKDGEWCGCSGSKACRGQAKDDDADQDCTEKPPDPEEDDEAAEDEAQRSRRKASQRSTSSGQV